MNYFCPKTNYYIIPILDMTNGHILYGGESLYSYVFNAFPVLVDLDRKRATLLYGERQNSMIPNDMTEEYKAYCKLLDAALDYLYLPKHLLATGNDFEAFEPATKTRLYNGNLNFSVLSSKRVSDCSLPEYYIDDYEGKTDNFFCPNEFVREKAHLSSSKFIEELCSNDMVDEETKRFFGYGTSNKKVKKGRI